MPKTKSRYIISLIAQLALSLFAVITFFVNGRTDSGSAPDSFARIGAAVLGTVLFVYLWSGLNDSRKGNISRALLIAGYVMVFMFSVNSILNDYFALGLCGAVMSAAGVIVYSCSEDWMKSRVKDKLSAKIAVCGLAVLSVLCSAAGNIMLIFSGETTLPENICAVTGIIMAAASGTFLIAVKRRFALTINAAVLAMSGFMIQFPFGYLLLLLILLHIAALNKRFTPFSSSEESCPETAL